MFPEGCGTPGPCHIFSLVEAPINPDFRPRPQIDTEKQNLWKKKYPRNRRKIDPENTDPIHNLHSEEESNHNRLDDSALFDWNRYSQASTNNNFVE